MSLSTHEYPHSISSQQGKRKNDGDGILVNLLLLERLPEDAICSVLDYCSDLETVLNLGRINSRFRDMVLRQNWHCDRCSTAIFASISGSIDDDDDDNNNNEKQEHVLDFYSKSSSSSSCKPFVCSSCNGKFCGETIDYDKRFCRPQLCEGCGTTECRKCMWSSFGRRGGYGNDSSCLCLDCQDEYGGAGGGGYGMMGGGAC